MNVTLNQLPKNFVRRTSNLAEHLIAEDVSYEEQGHGKANWRMHIALDDGNVMVFWLSAGLRVM